MRKTPDLPILHHARAGSGVSIFVGADMGRSYFVLRDKQVAAATELVWARTLGRTDHRIAETRIDGRVTIRTDFVGAGEILFETCVYLGPEQKYVQRARCETFDRAINLHQQFVQAWSRG